MKEENSTTPKKPFLYYCLLVFLMMMLLNAFVFPQMKSANVEEVPYGTFLSMIDQQDISQVEIKSNEIIFTDDSDPKNYYKTGRVDDPELSTRLYRNGIKDFGTPIVQETSPLMTILLMWILPMILLMGVGQLLMRKFAKGGGMGNFMSFGNSNAKVYVPVSYTHLQWRISFSL